MNIHSTILPCSYTILIYIMHIWELLIDNIFPPSPEELIVRSATTEHIIKEYCPSQIHSVYFLSNYQRKLIKACVTTAKFSHNKKASRLLATLLNIWLNEHKEAGVLLIPIPLHPAREQERGYNQVTRVLEELSLPKTAVAKNVLSRNRNTTPQTKLDKDRRTKNITGAFTVDAKQLKVTLTPGIKRIIICDDVYTTGSTFKEAQLALAPHIPKNCQLVCLAWAH